MVAIIRAMQKLRIEFANPASLDDAKQFFTLSQNCDEVGV